MGFYERRSRTKRLMKCRGFHKLVIDREVWKWNEGGGGGGKAGPSNKLRHKEKAGTKGNDILTIDR